VIDLISTDLSPKEAFAILLIGLQEVCHGYIDYIVYRCFVTCFVATGDSKGGLGGHSPLLKKKL